MLAKRIVACLDICGERVVKGKHFRNLRDAGEPLARALSYCAQGIDEIVILDVSATLESRPATLKTVAAVATAVDVPVTVGGGVRNVDDIARLLDAGADKVAVNSAAVASPHLLSLAAERFGAQCVVLSIDAFTRNGRFELATHSASVRFGMGALEWASTGEQLGAGEILLTSIDRDGTRNGFDVALISAASSRVGIPVVASGGGYDAASFADALSAGAEAALGASVFHYGDLEVSEVKQCCAARGIPVRQ